MAKAILKNEENTPYAWEGYFAEQDTADDDATFVRLNELETVEAYLSEQKESLSSLLSQLRLKLKEEVENRTRRVQTLNSEVTELKSKCEKFAKWLNNSEELE
jgi:hypothetical protein